MDKEMRRKDKMVADEGWIEDVLRNGQVIYLAIATKQGEPYVVPMGYGYADRAIYVHGAKCGLKNDIIASNPSVSFNISTGVELIKSDTGSNFSMKYRSVTGFGDISELTGLSEKNAALAAIMRQYDGPHTDLTDDNKNSVWVAKIEIKRMTGKSSGHPKP
jgi:nitroimidazol reductase NimA-like FMN-containing flavoprotein (pyridoxamine 5'-phosphate oxidase superfamily)